MEDVERKKDLSDRVHDAKMNLLWAVIKFFVMVAIFVIIFVPYKKAEIDDTVIVINPITLIYYSASFDKNTRRVENKIRGIATKGAVTDSSGKEEKYYVFNLIRVSESAFEEKGKFSVWQSLNMCWFI